MAVFRAARYLPYDGPRSRFPAWWPILGSTVRRGWKSLWVRRITLASLMLAFGLMVFFYVLNKVVPDWRNLLRQFGEMSTGDEGTFRVDARFYAALMSVFVIPILLPLALAFGSGLVASDLRSNAIEAYFARPVTPLGYLFGRSLAFVGFLLAATLVPLLVVWGSDVTTAPSDHFDEVAGVPWGLTRSLVLIAVVVALLVQAVATLTRNATATNVFLGVFFVFFQGLGQSLARSTGRDAFRALSFLDDVRVIGAANLGLLTPERAADLPPLHLAHGFVFGLGLLSFLLTWRALRRRSMLA